MTRGLTGWPAKVAVTILPSTDLHLMGRSHDHAVPRGVVPAEPLTPKRRGAL